MITGRTNVKIYLGTLSAGPLNKRSFTNYVITKGEGGFGMITPMQSLLYPMPNLITEGGGGLETDKK